MTRMMKPKLCSLQAARAYQNQLEGIERRDNKIYLVNCVGDALVLRFGGERL